MWGQSNPAGRPTLRKDHCDRRKPMSSCAVAVVVVRRIYAARKNPPHKIQVVGQPICEDEALAPDIPSHVSQVLVHVTSPSSWYKVAAVRIRHAMVQGHHSCHRTSPHHGTYGPCEHVCLCAAVKPFVVDDNRQWRPYSMTPCHNLLSCHV